MTADTPMAPPPLKDDCFAMPPGVDWVPVDEALARLRAGLAPVTAIEDIALADAGGRVLTADIAAPRAHPPFANSAVDGFGLAHGTLGLGEVVTLPLHPGRAAAGEPFFGTLPPGKALRVLTGAALPPGVDTVVLEEDCTVEPDRIAFRTGLRAGANTRPEGEDIGVGDPLARTGQVLTPGRLAPLASTGVARVWARRRLRVGVLSTGTEIVEPGAAAAPGQIFDANRVMLLSQLAAWGYVPVDLGQVPDDPGALRAALNGAQADAILTSGGASAGDEDHVARVLAQGGTLHTWRIAVKPGRPLALALWRGTPVFGLPGNPVAALICTLIFARPALRVLAGEAWTEPTRLTVPAGFAKHKKPGRREYLRARLRDGRIEVFGSEGSGRVTGLAWAEGLVELPDHGHDVAPGDPVSYLPFWGM
ncbi:MAG: gephyrin-like molybdotransferase Glp [Pseudomonadota bacterium]